MSRWPSVGSLVALSSKLATPLQAPPLWWADLLSHLVYSPPTGGASWANDGQPGADIPPAPQFISKKVEILFSTAEHYEGRLKCAGFAHEPHDPVATSCLAEHRLLRSHALISKRPWGRRDHLKRRVRDEYGAESTSLV